MITLRHGIIALCLVLSQAVLTPVAHAQDPSAMLALMDMSAKGGGDETDADEYREPLPPATPTGEAGNSGFSVEGGGRLELHARNLDVAEAFAQLRQLIRRNIVVAPDIDARFNGDLYGVTPEEAIEVICRSTDLVSRDEGSYIYVEASAPDTRIYELNHARGADLVVMIQPLLSEVGAISSTIPAEQGIRSTQEEAGGDDYASTELLVVSDYPRVLKQVDLIIEAADREPQQVMIEATILTAQLTDGMELGVQFSSLWGVDWDTSGTVSGNNISTDDVTFVDGDLRDGIATAGTGLADNLSTGGLNVGFLKDGISGFLRALSTLTETTLLANPQILTVNKQRGEVLLGRRDGYLTTTVTQTSTIQKVEYLETGTRLVFRPFITPGGLVRLEIHPEDSDGGINANGLPFKTTAEITTNVVVRSGETVVVGGLFRDRQQTVENNVPWLGSLPVLGWLFRSSAETTIREEIIILITPKIMESAADMLATAEELPPWEFGDIIDTDALAGSYLQSARSLESQQKIAAASYMVDLAEDLIGEDPSVRTLRRRLWNGRLEKNKTEAIDRRITEQLLGSAEGSP
ncbi:MAG: type IV pilus assembly protein PilQ [Pseudohongiellaceae bacterium]